ncbi:MAG: anti-sigma factor [Comamonadaceae bacterium]|nr:MAG: anti-sigma factor [Comamonadaceae bacterium]
MSDQLTLQCRATAADLAQLLSQVDSFGQRQGWTAHALSQVRLVLEELVVNIVSYGVQDGQVPELALSLVQQGLVLDMEISDNGVAFDPLQAAAPDLSADLDHRPVGGLGIFLVTQLADTLDYQRDGQWNRLRVSLSLR